MNSDVSHLNLILKQKSKNNTKIYLGLLLLIILAILLVQPKLLGPYGIIIWVLLGFISFNKAEYTVFYLLLSQVLPDIMGIPGNLAQWAIIIWVIYRIFSRRKINYKILKPMASYLLPLIIWLSISAIANTELPFYFIELLKGAVFIFIIFDAVQDRDVDFVEIGAYIILACLFAGFTFWSGDRLTLNENVGFIGGNRGFIRIEGLRGNANVVMVFLSFAFVGIIHRWIQAQFSGVKIFLGSSLSFLVLAILIVAPLISTQSRTTYFVIAIMILIILFFEVPHIKKINNFVLVFFEISILIIAIILSLNVFLPSWLLRIQDLILYQSTDGDLFSGRSYLWEAGLQTILKYPVFGTRFSEFTFLTGGFSTSHNTIIDSGIMAGVPGIIFTIIYLFSPLFLIKKNIKYSGFRLFLGIYLTGLLISMSIALQGIKIMYILWALMFSMAIYYMQSRKAND